MKTHSITGTTSLSPDDAFYVQVARLEDPGLGIPHQRQAEARTGGGAELLVAVFEDGVHGFRGALRAQHASRPRPSFKRPTGLRS